MSDGIPLFGLSEGMLIGDRYRVVGTHRRGGLSTAFEVADEETSERRELQVFPGALFDDVEETGEFTQILQQWKAVESDHVLRVRDVVMMENGTLALITDYPAGVSLREELSERERYEHEDVRRFGRQLLSGLVEIHRNGLVHGDIKPSTISLEETGLVLVDGGVTPGLWMAKDWGDKTALIGTPYYAPIEQFGGDSPNVQSDIYNVATVLFECATGVLPWPGVTFVEVFQAKLDKTLPSMRRRAPDVEVDPELEAVICQGCQADRKLRFTSAEEFLESLTALD